MRAVKSAREEIARILEGRNVWQLLLTEEGVALTTGPHLVLTVKQFLPAGGEPKPGFPSGRVKSLVDLICDDGRRVFAVADIWSRNPEQASDPW